MNSLVRYLSMSTTTLTVLARVCRAFNGEATRVLYHCPPWYRLIPERQTALLRTLCMNPNLARIAQNYSVMQTWRSHKAYLELIQRVFQLMTSLEKFAVHAFSIKIDCQTVLLRETSSSHILIGFRLPTIWQRPHISKDGSRHRERCNTGDG